MRVSGQLARSADYPAGSGSSMPPIGPASHYSHCYSLISSFNSFFRPSMQMLDYDTQPATAEHVSDAAITAAVELFFLIEKGMPAHLIDVSTHEGIVQLAGITDNLLAKERAEEITLAVRSVRGVVNELLISTPDMADEELKRHLATALTDYPATADYNVQASAADGVVRVTGIVQSWAEKQLVLRVLRGVRGVRRLHFDNLVIQRGEVQNSDEEISTQIHELLDWDIRVHSALVEIRTNDRVVHLSGSVGSAAEKAQVIATTNQAGASRLEREDNKKFIYLPNPI